MATGPEHYKRAEELILARPGLDETTGTLAGDIALAQVHATLALAAATAMHSYAQDGMHHADFNAWDDVCGERRRSES